MRLIYIDYCKYYIQVISNIICYTELHLLAYGHFRTKIIGKKSDFNRVNTVQSEYFWMNGSDIKKVHSIFDITE